MKLRHSPTSPYVRKVDVVAMETGLTDRIERVPTNPWDPEGDLPGDNPLGKVPALIADDGTVFCDSPVICEYLDSQHGGAKMIPATGPARWQALNLETLADGILDAAIARVIENKMRPAEFKWDGWLTRQSGKIERALDVLEREAAAGILGEPGADGPVTIGTISVGCALGYLDFRFGDEDWRASRPKLAAWYEDFSKRPSMQATVPKG